MGGNIGTFRQSGLSQQPRGISSAKVHASRDHEGSIIDLITPNCLKIEKVKDQDQEEEEQVDIRPVDKRTAVGRVTTLGQLILSSPSRAGGDVYILKPSPRKVFPSVMRGKNTIGSGIKDSEEEWREHHKKRKLRHTNLNLQDQSLSIDIDIAPAFSHAVDSITMERRVKLDGREDLWEGSYSSVGRSATERSQRRVRIRSPKESDIIYFRSPYRSSTRSGSDEEPSPSLMNRTEDFPNSVFCSKTQ